MRTTVPEKLLKIVEDIDQQGQAEPTRLTVLKKWFAQPGRLPAFAVFIAARATSRKGKTAGEAAARFREAKALLAGHDKYGPVLDRAATQALFERLVAYQNEFERQQWGAVRIIRNWNLLLIEEALSICLASFPDPAAGYRLAADYCRNYDPRYGTSLNGPSSTKILEIVRWMFTLEANEEYRAAGDVAAAIAPSPRPTPKGRWSKKRRPDP